MTQASHEDGRRADVPHILLLSPSIGLGGGVERYVSTIEDALVRHRVAHDRLDLVHSSRGLNALDKARFLRDVRRHLQAADRKTRLVLGHRDLLPVVPIVERLPSYLDSLVILHGNEVWGRRVRRERLMARRGVRLIAVSNFTAGSLVRIAPAGLLPPGLAKGWFDTLATARVAASGPLDIVTACRLSDWRDKGIGALLDAVAMVDHPGLRLTICGSGHVPDQLQRRVKAAPNCRLLPNLSDVELAGRLASAYVFVLATRTRGGRASYGEGFGMVLLEAQVAGAPVIGPAHGGSGDAFQLGITGLAPVDESPAALAVEICRLVEDPDLRARMASAAAAWARSRFDPNTHARRVVETLVGAVGLAIVPGMPTRPTRSS